MDAETTVLAIEHIVTTPNVVGGRPRIAGRRISVARVVDQYLNYGASLETLAEMYDLTSGQIHAALSYYYDHRETIDAQIAAERAYEAQHYSETPVIHRPGEPRAGE